MIAIFSLVMLAMGIFKSNGLDCPGNTFIPCCPEGNACMIPAGVTSGYFSFGKNGKYVITPFTNDGGKSLEMGCSEYSWGDLVSGQKKYCCYLESKVAALPTTEYTKFGEESSGTYYEIPAGSTIKFGKNGQYIYAASPDVQYLDCFYRKFGDVAAKVTKDCFSTKSIPQSLSLDEEWKTCAKNGETCTGLSKSAVQWVRHVSQQTRGYARLIVAQDGEIPCSDDALHDPNPGQSKYCQYGKPLLLFGDSVGRWERIQSCGGGECTHSISITYGVTQLTEETLSEEWAASFTSSISESLIFEQAELSTTMSMSVATSMTNSLEVSKTIETTFSCRKDALYQWIVNSVQSNIITETGFTVQSQDTWCLDDPKKPQCPPGFCEDDDCQICSQPLRASGVKIAMPPKEDL